MADMMPGMGAPEMAPTEPSIDQLAAFEQLREQVSPTEFNREMLATAEQADPVAVAEFRRELAALEVAPEVLDMLNTMVDEVLAAPGEYPAIREKYLAMGVDEELLPEVFDAGVFAALNMALDELRGPGTMMPVQGFARGGIASLKPLAREMAAAGRYGDTMIAHISPMEAQILRRYGGSGTINPRTGAPEFFLKNMFKKIGRAVKKFASSTVGKLVTTVALGFFLGPAAAGLIGASSPAAVAAVSGFVGSAGSTMLGGGNVKDALKAGAIGGLTAGATTAVFKGADAFKPVPKAGTASAAAAPATGTEMSLPELNAPAPATTFPSSPNAAATLGRSPMPPPGGVESLVSKGTPPGAGGSLASTGTPAAPSAGVVNLGQYAPPSAGAPSTVANYLGQTSPQGFDLARAGAAPSAQQTTNSMLDRIVPSRIREAAEESAFQKVADRFKVPGGAEAVRRQLATNNASDAVVAAYAEASKVGLGQYLPMAGIGIAALGAMGGFEEEPVEVPAGSEGMMEGEGAGSKLLEKYPERYGINLGQIQTLSSYPYTTPQRLFGAGAPQRAATGGIMSLDRYPRKNGHIAGPGTGTSDEIPAMLSDGEFVFTAKAVRAMGDGSRRKGAKRMYALMKKLEGRTNG
jgi:hypothetical protein